MHIPSAIFVVMQPFTVFVPFFNLLKYESVRIEDGQYSFFSFAGDSSDADTSNLYKKEVPAFGYPIMLTWGYPAAPEILHNIKFQIE